MARYIIGKRIRKLRKEKNYTLKSLGEKTNISPSFIGDIESGRTDPSLKKLKNIASALEVSISYLLNEEPNARYRDITNITDIKQFVSIISRQPTLNLNGEALSEVERVILTNTVEMGIKTIEEIRKTYHYKK